MSMVATFVGKMSAPEIVIRMAKELYQGSG
jgi:hypothetical protein